MSDRDRVIKDTTEVINMLTATKQLDDDITVLNDALAVITELMIKLVKENSKTGLSLDEYNKKYDELTGATKRLKHKMKKVWKRTACRI